MVTPPRILILALLLPLAALASPPSSTPEGSERPPERERGRHRGMPPIKPFLMAGHPEFARMIEAALAPESQVAAHLERWPRYQEMDEAARRDLRQGFERMRRRIREEALEDATARGWTIPPEKEAEFVRTYWARRIQVERTVRERAERDWKAAMDQMMAELGRTHAPAP